MLSLFQIMYSFQIPIFAVKNICFVLLYASSHTKNGQGVRLEKLDKEFRRPRHIREENCKNNVGEIICKMLDSIKWLSIGTRCGLN